MDSLIVGIIAIMCVSVAIQAWLVYGFANKVRRPQGVLLSDDQCPKAAVILCLRGGDPFLSRCIDALLAQKYPWYKVFFVVDHPSDPSDRILRAVLARHEKNNFEIQYLNDPLETCSLKCSSILQAYKSVDEQTEFIAQLDADTVCHQNWHRELATALDDEAVGAVSGNRWYSPDSQSNGALVRHIWNAAAIVQMTWYRIAWGGTLAIKTSAIKQAQLDTKWASALCEDTMLTEQLGSIGKRVEFVPGLLMVNREDCTLRTFMPWVVRQLLTARLYHRAWPLVALHGICSALILLIGWSLVVGFLWSERIIQAGILGLAMIFFQIALVLLVLWIGRAVESSLGRLGREPNWKRPSLLGWFLGVTLTQWIYSLALLRCLFARSTSWRGVCYGIQGPWQVTMKGYKPFSEAEHENTQGVRTSL